MKNLLEEFFIKERKTIRRIFLGQIKLVKNDILEKISEFVDHDDIVIEIGGGEGNLTELLSKRAKMTICFEIDKRYKDKILEKIKFGIALNEDFLSIPIYKIKDLAITDYRGDLNEIKFILNSTDKFKIVANIPYYISSKLIHKLISFDFFHLKSVHILVQKEFAQKVCAKPGSQEYSAISAIANFFFDTKINFDVPRFYFRPTPKVHSSFLSLIPKKITLQENQINKFIDFIYALFQRRKRKIGGKRVYQLTPHEIFDFFLSELR